MKTRLSASGGRQLTRALGAAVGLVLAVSLWLLLAPQSLGGDFSYVFISGNSMAPQINGQDLVLLRSADDYKIGDAVAYTHPQLGTILHRIVGDDGAQFTLRGDNRNSDDSYQPTADEILGRQWIKIPDAAGIIRELQTPRSAILLTLATLAIGMVSRRAGRGKHDPGRPPRRRRGGRAISGGGRGGGSSPPTGRGTDGSGDATEAQPGRAWGLSSFSFYSANYQPLAVLLALFLGSAAMIGFVRLQGTTHTVSETLPYVTNSTFSYGAAVEGGIYDGDRLGAPEPVFRKLTERIPLDYHFAIDPAAPGLTLGNTAGSYQIVAEVSLENGWKRTIDLTPLTLFSGQQLNASATIELADVQAVIDQMQEATGISTDIYNLRVKAKVDFEADLDGIPISGSVEQQIEFQLTELQLKFNPRASDIESTIPAAVARDVLVERSMAVPIAGISVPFSTIPRLGLYGVGAAMAGLLAMLAATMVVWHAGEAARIRVRYGHLIVGVRYDELELAERVLTVGRFLDLARIAEAEGLMIFHRLARPATLEAKLPDREPFDPEVVSELRDDPRRLVDEYLAGGADALELVNSRRVSSGRLFGDTPPEQIDEYFVVDRDITFRYATGDGANADAAAEPDFAVDREGGGRRREAA